MKKKLPMYILIAFMCGYILYILSAPFFIANKIERETAIKVEERGK